MWSQWKWAELGAVSPRVFGEQDRDAWPCGSTEVLWGKGHRKAGAQRCLAMTFTCSPSLTKSFVCVQWIQGVPVWCCPDHSSALKPQWPCPGVPLEQMLLLARQILPGLIFHDGGISPGHISSWPMQRDSPLITPPPRIKTYFCSKEQIHLGSKDPDDKTLPFLSTEFPMIQSNTWNSDKFEVTTRACP